MEDHFLFDFQIPFGIYFLPDLVPKLHTLKITDAVSFEQPPILTQGRDSGSSLGWEGECGLEVSLGIRMGPGELHQHRVGGEHGVQAWIAFRHILSWPAHKDVCHMSQNQMPAPSPQQH